MSENKTRSTVLVVDDSRTVRAAINKVLAPNYDVIQAEDGEDGWKKLVENPSARMLITDIMMPNLDGYGLICRIRAAQQDDIKNIPIVVVTSSEDAITRERAHACGANDFIVKPVQSSDLIERANFHTEHKLSGKDFINTSEEFGEIESSVIEAPDIKTALEIIRGAKDGAVEPFAMDLAIEVIPLLEYCNEKFDLGLDVDIKIIKARLENY